MRQRIWRKNGVPVKILASLLLSNYNRERERDDTALLRECVGSLILLFHILYILYTYISTAHINAQDCPNTQLSLKKLRHIYITNDLFTKIYICNNTIDWLPSNLYRLYICIYEHCDAHNNPEHIREALAPHSNLSLSAHYIICINHAHFTLWMCGNDIKDCWLRQVYIYARAASENNWNPHFCRAIYTYMYTQYT